MKALSIGAGISRRLMGPFGLVVVFLLSFCVFGLMVSTPNLLDPDSFYHAKMALLLGGGNLTRNFAWLPLTTLAGSYADHHFLYHLALVPFVKFFGVTVGLKVSAALFAATAITVFYFVLRRFSVPFPWFFAFVLSTAGVFALRLSLAKTVAPSVALLLLAFYFLRGRRFLPVFLISFVWVWTHGSWPLALLLSGANLVVESALERRFSRKALSLAMASLGGIAAGLIVNPYFPANFLFYWEQTVQIVLVGHVSGVVVGNEWSPFTLIGAFQNMGSLFVLAMVIAAVALARVLWSERLATKVADADDDKRGDIALAAFMASVFFCMIFRSQRYVDYFAPLFTLYLSLASAWLFARLRLDETFELVAEKSRGVIGQKTLLVILITYFVMIGGAYFLEIRGMRMVEKPWFSVASASAVLALVPDGELVFHSRWDDFPSLILADDRLRYVSGLDPNFLHRANPQLGRLYDEIVAGNVKAGLAETIIENFGARYCFTHPDDKIADVVAHDAHFRLLRDENGLQLYEILITDGI